MAHTDDHVQLPPHDGGPSGKVPVDCCVVAAAVLHPLPLWLVVPVLVGRAGWQLFARGAPHFTAWNEALAQARDAWRPRPRKPPRDP